jgi:F420-non-reducing hydrogenase small subunit
VADQGAKFVSAIASIIEARDPDEVDAILDRIPDLWSYAYRFGLPASLLQRSVGA